MNSQRVRRPDGPQDWEAQRDVITDLYIAKGLELEDLMKTMEDDHFFKATKKQYKTHFTKWDLRKNVRSSEYNAIIRKRREREEEGKGSAFRLRGALVDDSKIVRYEKKTKTGYGYEIAEAGTPEELSCFTPSPVASSPILPSADLPHLKWTNLLRTSIVSPSEQAFLGPNAASPNLAHNSIALTSVKVFFGPTLLRFSPEPPKDEVDLTFSVSTTALLSTTALVDRLASWKSVKLDIFSRNSRNSRYWNRSVQGMNDIIRDTECYSYELTGADLSDFMIIRRSILMHFVLKKLSDIGFISNLVAQLKTASTELGIQNFSDSLRICDITTPGNGRGSASGFELSVTGLGCDLVIKFSSLISLELEQKHNPDGRRRESFDSVMSLDSFLSDPVVDWNELLYGYNR